MVSKEELEIIADTSLIDLGWIVFYSGINIELDMPIHVFIRWLVDREKEMIDVAEEIKKECESTGDGITAQYSSVTLNELEGINVLGLIITINPPSLAKKVIKLIEKKK